MKSPLIAVTAALLMLGATSAADAKGCIKGAVVGGVAGHYAGHHGVLGAAAGCLYGRHHANEQDKQQHHSRARRTGRASCKPVYSCPRRASAVGSLAPLLRGEGWGEGPLSTDELVERPVPPHPKSAKRGFRPLPASGAR